MTETCTRLSLTPAENLRALCRPDGPVLSLNLPHLTGHDPPHAHLAWPQGPPTEDAPCCLHATQGSQSASRSTPRAISPTGRFSVSTT
jgi:hypothetical protein